MKDPAREKAARVAIGLMEERNRLHEMPLAFGIDAYLHFNDLWNAVGYRNFMTVWEPLSNTNFWWARKKFADPEKPTPVEARNPPRLYNEHMGLIRKFIDGLCIKGSDGQWREDPDSKVWKEFEHLATTSLPEAMRRRMLAVVTYENPFYRRDLTPDEQVIYQIGIEGTLRRLNERSYTTVPVGKDFSIDDYFDILHFSESGGAKMAETVAPKVREIAKRLEYVK